MLSISCESEDSHKLSSLICFFIKEANLKMSSILGGSLRVKHCELH